MFSITRSLVSQITRNALSRNQLAARLGAAFYSMDANKIKELTTKSKVVIFMKGNPEGPRCGFSNAVVQILRMHGVKYDSHDVLIDEDIRQGKKIEILLLLTGVFNEHRESINRFSSKTF